MGMPDAFNLDKADFSGMTGSKDLFISDVLHKAFVEVNEEGTEAAAATGVIMRVTSMPAPPPVFRADHPFVFVIQDNHTGSILFVGRVVDPTEE
jgi:serpin B